MNRALFLDRDGVINADGDYLYRPEDINFLDGIFCLCRAAKEQGYRLIVATNQSGIARGYYTEEDFHRLTDWMCGKFTAKGATLDAVYFCPYHPEIGVGRYKADSFDRKPKPGMLLKARNEFDLDLSTSILIGDRDSDMEAGRAAGVGRLLFLPGKYDCLAAADVILVRSLWDAKQYL